MSRANSKEGFLRRPGNDLGLYKSTRCRGSNQRDRIGPFFIIPMGTRVGEGVPEGRSPPDVVIAMEETLAEQEDRNLNSDSSSSSSDDDDEAAEDVRIKTLEKSLAENPFDYDTNVQVIPSMAAFMYSVVGLVTVPWSLSFSCAVHSVLAEVWTSKAAAAGEGIDEWAVPLELRDVAGVDKRWSLIVHEVDAFFLHLNLGFVHVIMQICLICAQGNCIKILCIICSCSST